MSQLNEGQTAAALHGIATNKAYSLEERLQAALQALEWYEKQAEPRAATDKDLQAARIIVVEALRLVANDWTKMADNLEEPQWQEWAPDDAAALAQVVWQYRFAAALLRGRATRMELEPYTE